MTGGATQQQMQTPQSARARTRPTRTDSVFARFARPPDVRSAGPVLGPGAFFLFADAACPLLRT